MIERLSAETAIPPREWFLHQARYLFAAVRHTRGRSVLDLACGSGYGSELLARYGARSVLGVDIAEEAIAEARARHAHPRVQFEVGDVFDRTGLFDAVVSFETVEHVEEPERALDVFTRVLADDGILVVSTPNRDVTNPRATRHDTPSNPFHCVELSRNEFASALRERFRDVRFYGQAYRVPGRREGRAADALAWASAWPVRLPLRPTYVVAVCRGPRR